jgi:hypothetical protein
VNNPKPEGINYFLKNNEEVNVEEYLTSQNSIEVENRNHYSMDFSKDSDTSSDTEEDDRETPDMLPTFANQEILQRAQDTIVPTPNSQYKRDQGKNNDASSYSQERQVVYTHKEEPLEKPSSGIEKYSHLLPESNGYSNNDDSSDFSDEFLHGD